MVLIKKSLIPVGYGQLLRSLPVIDYCTYVDCFVGDLLLNNQVENFEGNLNSQIEQKEYTVPLILILVI